MFNERANAERCVRAIVRVLGTLDNRSSIIAVDDGSCDGTSEVLAALRGEVGTLEIVAHPANKGYGAALVSGAARAFQLGLEYVLFMDSDLTNDPDDIPRFAGHMASGVDVIKASRYVPGGRMVGVPWRRAAVSRLGNAVARLLFRVPVRDCTNGFRAVRTTLLVRMQLREPGFAIIVEELYWCRYLGATFAEIPVTLTNATRVTSFRYRPAVFLAYLRYPLFACIGRAPTATAPMTESR